MYLSDYDLFLDNITYGKAEELVVKNSFIIIPLGSIIPLGNISLGAVNYITFKISETIARKICALLLPVQNYGYTTMYSAFGGVCGFSKSNYESFVRSIIKDILHWGGKKIFLINSNFFADEILDKTLKRLLLKKKVVPEYIDFFTFSRPEYFNTCFEKYGFKNINIKYDVVLFSLSVYLDSRHKYCMYKGCKVEENIYKRWLKLGRDPDKFKKLFPYAEISRDINLQMNNWEKLGKEIFDFIVDLIYKKIIKDV